MLLPILIIANIDPESLTQVMSSCSKLSKHFITVLVPKGIRIRLQEGIRIGLQDFKSKYGNPGLVKLLIKVKTISANKYRVKPNMGVIKPNKTFVIRDDGKCVDEKKLQVILVSPPSSPVLIFLSLILNVTLQPDILVPDAILVLEIFATVHAQSIRLSESESSSGLSGYRYNDGASSSSLKSSSFAASHLVSGNDSRFPMPQFTFPLIGGCDDVMIWDKKKPQKHEMQIYLERFAKLLLGEDMGNGVCTAPAISYAITNLSG
ncbi:hypothetical protein L1887_32703 [Cichorium endivia]|nr:hypothetical protein L1887_32703 [Cichorium endivia]